MSDGWPPVTLESALKDWDQAQWAGFYPRKENMPAIVEAARSAAQSQARVAALEAALRELVACKDLKERADAIPEIETPSFAAGTMPVVWHRLMDEYDRRKPLAWQAARDALAGREGGA